MPGGLGAFPTMANSPGEQSKEAACSALSVPASAVQALTH